MSRLKLGREDLPVGRQLPWSIYDRRGVMLLRQGSVIASDRQRETLLMRGAYRDSDATLAQAAAARKAAGRSRVPEARSEARNPLERLYPSFSRLHTAFFKVEAGDPEGLAGLVKLARHLDELFAEAPDAMVGAVHVVHEYDYVLCHPVHCALLCLLLGRDLGFDRERRESLVLAALAQNFGMFRLQERLQRQTSSLSEAQRAELRAHPDESARMLEAVGCRDEHCLGIIRQHHERLDGGGYPRALSGDELLVEAQLVSLSDRYGAMISARPYAEARQPREVLQEFYVAAGGEAQPELVQRLIAALGVYPPGSFVSLDSGEEAVVLRRGERSHQPWVGIYIGADGIAFRRPRICQCGDGLQVRAIARPNPAIAMELGDLWHMDPKA